MKEVGNLNTKQKMNIDLLHAKHYKNKNFTPYAREPNFSIYSVSHGDVVLANEFIPAILQPTLSIVLPML